MAKRRNDWLACQDSGFADRYFNSDLNLVVRVIDSTNQNVALIRALPPHFLVESGPDAEFVNADSGSRRFELNQLPMLTGIVHIVKGEQERRVIPSVVRLETFRHSTPGRLNPAPLMFNLLGLRRFQGNVTCGVALHPWKLMRLTNEPAAGYCPKEHIMNTKE